MLFTYLFQRFCNYSVSIISYGSMGLMIHLNKIKCPTEYKNSTRSIGGEEGVDGGGGRVAN